MNESSPHPRPQPAVSPPRELVGGRALSRVFPPRREGEPSLHALREATFALPEGSITAVFGRSGSGKTTLLNLISGLDRPTSGRICFGGRDMTERPPSEWAALRRREIGFVFQRFLLQGRRSALDNTLLPLLLTGESLGEARRRARAALEAVGLARHVEAPCSTLSGGQSQRVAIARALAPEPRLLLADEPTGNLDQATAEEVLKLLVGLTRAHGLTMLVMTHDPLVSDVADRIWTIEEGRLDTSQVQPAEIPPAEA